MSSPSLHEAVAWTSPGDSRRDGDAPASSRRLGRVAMIYISLMMSVNVSSIDMLIQ
jgi:hypothetical protein